jgi:hypothetical protein
MRNRCKVRSRSTPSSPDPPVVRSVTACIRRQRLAPGRCAAALSAGTAREHPEVVRRQPPRVRCGGDARECGSGDGECEQRASERGGGRQARSVAVAGCFLASHANRAPRRLIATGRWLLRPRLPVPTCRAPGCSCEARPVACARFTTGIDQRRGRRPTNGIAARGGFCPNGLPLLFGMVVDSDRVPVLFHPSLSASGDCSMRDGPGNVTTVHISCRVPTTVLDDVKGKLDKKNGACCTLM